MTGGAAHTGGVAQIGGNQATGGALTATGGARPATGGANPTGGSLNTYSSVNGGSNATGGVVATGGVPAGGATTSKVTGGATSTALGGTTSAPLGGTTSTTTDPWPPSSTFTNPALWEDLPDPEVILVDGVYYYTASNMHYVPGAPILRSWDLVNWEFVGHAVPVYDYSAKYDLNGGQAYIKGTWASSLHYRSSNKTWYWMGCIEFGKTYVYTASSPEGTWSKHPAINNCYYDCGMLVNYDNDADDTMYVAYGGSGDISVAQLSADYLTQVKTQQVYTTNGSMTLEGSHFFKYNNYYYITPTRPANGEFVLRSTNVWGPYTIKTLIDGQSGPIAGGGTPHQGSFIRTQNGDWYYMAFQDAYPGGRIPVLAPVTWSTDGWPSVTLVSGAWGKSYPYPNVPRPPQATKSLTGTDTFSGTTLSPEWEWNHNPDNTKWSLSSGLKLETAKVTNDLYAARNTLTRRTLGPQSTATIQIDVSGMLDGDIAGLALFKNSSGWIGIKKSAGTMKVAMVSGLTQDLSTFDTTSTGTEAANAAFSGTTIYLRASADGRPSGGTKQGKFSYSTDGSTFTSLGSALTLSTDWQYFPGYRFAIFNYATSSLGGVVTVKSFTLTAP
jgi:beta-xylosidase